MDAIKTYLDNCFAAFPQTESIKALKREMLADMEEKYYAFKKEGKSEHEAVGGVIANFGSIDEIIAELGIEPSKDEPADSLILSGDEAHTYLNQTKKSGRWIGFGVWIILLGVSAMLLFDMEVSGRWDWSVNLGAAGIFVLFLAIAAAVPIFIINGIQMNRYEDWEKKDIRLDEQTRAEMGQQRSLFKPRFAAQISIGVALIIFAVGTFAFLGEILGSVYESLLPAIFIFIIGFSVYLFITAGMTYSAYDILLSKGDYANKKCHKKSERLISTIAAVYWPLMTAIFLAWSFIGNAWDKSWIIWPIAGVAFGAIAGGIGTWYETKSKDE